MTYFSTNRQGNALNHNSENKSNINSSIMTSLQRVLLVATLALVTVIPATAQVKMGIRGGLTLNKMKFDREVINSDNRLGYSAGVVLDVNIPVVGIGVEASAMYTYREDKLFDDNEYFKRHYIDIPIHARYRLSLPAARKIVAPIVFTGPSFSVLFKDDAPTKLENSKTYLSWDVGAGVDLFKHLRLTASYSIGMSKAMEYIDREYTGGKVQGKDNHWTISAAWMF